MGNKGKNEENNEVSQLNRASFSFTLIFSDWPPLNRESRFSRSDLEKRIFRFNRGKQGKK